MARFTIDPQRLNFTTSQTGKEYQTRLLQRAQTIFTTLLNLLASNYISAIQGPNYTVELNAVAVEMARLELALEDVDLDRQFSTTRSDFIYSIAGYLLLLNGTIPPLQFSDTSFRQFLLSLIKIYFQGSIPLSIQDAVNLFLTGSVTVTENFLLLRAGASGLDISDEFGFNIDVQGFPADLFDVDSSIRQIIDIIRPAHTLYTIRYIFSDTYLPNGSSGNSDTIGKILDAMRSSLGVYYYEDFRTYWGGIRNRDRLGEKVNTLISAEDHSLAPAPTKLELSAALVGSASTVMNDTSGFVSALGGVSSLSAALNSTYVLYMDKGPLAKPPLVMQSGINATITSAVAVTVTGGSVTSALVGKYLSVSGSAAGNNGSFLILSSPSSTSVGVAASFNLPDTANGTLVWSIFDPRNGQIANEPSDVTVLINSSLVTPVSVSGLLGQVVLPSAPNPNDTVAVSYYKIQNPTVDVRALNSSQFRLNSWNRDLGYPTDPSGHKYRYNNTLVVPSEYVPTDVQATLAQPELRDVKYRAYERAYTPVLNDPTLLTLNSPIHKIAYPPLSRTVESVFVDYEALNLPENDPVAPWTKHGIGVVTVADDQLTVVNATSGPFPTGNPPFWTQGFDVNFPHIFAATWRVYVEAEPVTEGVFTGVCAGYSDSEYAFVLGFLVSNGTNMLGILKQGDGNDPSQITAWTGGLASDGVTPTNAPIVLDWSVVHSYRVFTDTNGNISVYLDGSVVPSLQISTSALPYLEELNAPFNELEGAFFGSLSKLAQNTSVWSFYRYDIIAINPQQSQPTEFVSYEGTTIPEQASQPWTPIGSAGTETIVASSYMVLDSTSATDEVTEQAAGLVSGDFRGYTRIEPLLSVSSDTVLDINVQLRTYTHGITPNAVMACVDDGTYITQLCFFPGEAVGKLSYGGRAFPDQFTPTTWTAMGGATVSMVGRLLLIDDTTITDGKVYFIEDTQPVGSSTRTIAASSDYVVEFRNVVLSATPDSNDFAGVMVQAFDGLRSVGLLFQEATVGSTTTRYISFHSDGLIVGAPIVFNWFDGNAHTYRLVKSTSGNLVTLFIDTIFIGTADYSSFVASTPPSNTGILSFGSALPTSLRSTSTVQWYYVNAWAVASSPHQYVGLWKGTDPNALTGYHLPLKASNMDATVGGNSLGDTSVDFLALGVTTNDVLIIDVGGNKGVYPIASVAQHSLTIPLALYPTGFPVQPSTVGYRIPLEVDWTVSHRYRVIRDPGGGISVLLDTNPEPLIQIGYNQLDLPPSYAGIPRVLAGGLPSISFGAFDPTNLSQTQWNFVRYGITSAPFGARIAPHHQFLNQRNVMASPDRLYTSIPHTLTDFWSNSTGIPPELEPDFLQNPGLVAFTLLNEGTPIVPLTQNFETRFELQVPKTQVIYAAALNTPAVLINDQSTFTLNNATTLIQLIVPDDVLYNSLQIIETDTGTQNLITTFDDFDSPMDLGTLSYQNEVCLSYDAGTLPEQDPTAPTPWSLESVDSSQVFTTVFNGVLTYGTQSTGTRTAYINETPLPNAPGLVSQYTYKLKIANDSSGGSGDTQVRVGFSAPGMTVSLAFVTAPSGERYVFVVDQVTQNIVGGRRFDFLDGNYHQYRIVRDPSAANVSVFIDS